jgi:hypothetical protein
MLEEREKHLDFNQAGESTNNFKVEGNMSIYGHSFLSSSNVFPKHASQLVWEI